MYFAVKNGRRVRIPDSMVKQYEDLGYTCTKAGEGKSKARPGKAGKAEKTETAKE